MDKIDTIKVDTYRRESVIPLLPLLTEWGVREYAKYPYLGSFPKEQIIFPSDLVLVNSRDAMVALAKIEEKIVGMLALISFDSVPLHTQYFGKYHLLEKVQSLGFDPSTMLYAAYFLTAPECHNDALIVRALYNTLATFAHEKGKTQICYMEDISEPEHSLKATKTSIEPWGDVISGFKSMGIQIGISWPTLQSNDVVHESEHILEFFIKDLEQEGAMQQEIEIMSFQKKYQDQVISLILGIQNDEFKVNCTIDQQPDLQNITNIYQKGNGGFWIALDRGKVIGTIALLDIGQNECALKKMFVNPEYRGSGVAKSLLNTLIASARQKNVKTIYLGTVPVYFAAHRFYEKNGFTEIPQEKLPSSFPVMAVDKKFYKIHL